MGKKSDAEAYWIGFDLGGTKMLSQIYDHQFNRLAQERERTNGHEGADTGVERIIKLIHQTLKSSDISSGKLTGIGIGCPGPLDLDEGVIVEAPNLGWKQVPIRKMLESEFACPVTISNDVDAGMYGEYRFGLPKEPARRSAFSLARASAAVAFTTDRFCAAKPARAWKWVTFKLFQKDPCVVVVVAVAWRPLPVVWQ